MAVNKCKQLIPLCVIRKSYNIVLHTWMVWNIFEKLSLEKRQWRCNQHSLFNAQVLQMLMNIIFLDNHDNWIEIQMYIKIMFIHRFLIENIKLVNRKLTWEIWMRKKGWRIFSLNKISNFAVVQSWSVHEMMKSAYISWYREKRATERAYQLPHYI